MAGKSIKDSVLLLTNYIYKALDINKRLIGVFIDFSKAQDNVQHFKLLTSLERIGNVFELLKSYLIGRKQQ